jgi:hypothetical protein
MTENTFKGNSFKKKRENFAFWDFLGRSLTLNLEPILAKNVPTRYIPRVLFLAVLALFYIANAHYAEQLIRQTNKLETEVEEARAKHATHKAEYDSFAGRKAEIGKFADSLGLVEGKGKIQKILIPKNEY